jgi:prepilin-type processing-associated H-X9-DG protein
MEPVVGNRGPEIARIERNAEGKLVAKTALEKSKTFLIHGEPDKWEGNVAFADGHVEFLTDLLPDIDPESNKWPTYRRENKRVLDCLFLDEPDDVTRSNAFLGIFVSSPDLVKGTKPIWD